jgi:hypothetical protein
VRGLLTWLTILGVLAGAFAYASADSCCGAGEDGAVEAVAEHATCEAAGCPPEESSHDHSKEDHCHHHHTCCHAVHLLNEADTSRVAIVDSSMAAKLVEAELAPDSPVFEVDTPPLI